MNFNIYIGHTTIGNILSYTYYKRSQCASICIHYHFYPSIHFIVFQRYIINHRQKCVPILPNLLRQSFIKKKYGYRQFIRTIFQTLNLAVSGELIISRIKSRIFHLGYKISYLIDSLLSLISNFRQYNSYILHWYQIRAAF